VRYKTEGIRSRGPWRGLEAVEFATLEWVEWFNHRRILEPIGDRPPAEAEVELIPEILKIRIYSAINRE